MSILEETLIPLTAASKEIASRPHQATCRRWATKGCRGHVLETVLIGARIYTSKEAIIRFYEAINSKRTSPAGGGFSPPTNRSNERADRELQRLGL